MFVAGTTMPTTTSVSGLPMRVDVSGNTSPTSMYSHARFPSNAAGITYTWSTGATVVVPATTDVVVAIPPGATGISSSAGASVMLGSER